jgi:phage I-like protein
MATKHSTKRKASGTAVAALSIAIADRTGKSIQLLPAGKFAAVDGRPANMAACSHWELDAQNAQELIAAAAARTNAAVIDYEHQTLLKEQNGRPAPAAGWFKHLEWREGVGLFATDVEWTPNAAQSIADGEYRYISPVIRFDDQSGRVTGLMMAALTNYAGIDGMQPASLAAMSSHFFNVDPDHLDPEPEEPTMKLLLAALFAHLKLDPTATEDSAIAALNAYTTKATEAEGKVATLSAQVATATTGTPDPSKFVPIEAVTQLQTQLSVLSDQVNGDAVDKVVQAALSTGKLLPALEHWARDLGKKDLAALNAFITATPAIAALNGTQTGGKAPTGDNVTALSAEELAILKNLGVTEDAYKKTVTA